MQEFPRLVFRSPGPAQCQGGSYTHNLVVDEGSFIDALANGWYASLPEAITTKITIPEPEVTPEPGVSKSKTVMKDASTQQWVKRRS